MIVFSKRKYRMHTHVIDVCRNNPILPTPDEMSAVTEGRDGCCVLWRGVAPDGTANKQHNMLQLRVSHVCETRHNSIMEGCGKVLRCGGAPPTRRHGNSSYASSPAPHDDTSLPRSRKGIEPTEPPRVKTPRVCENVIGGGQLEAYHELVCLREGDGGCVVSRTVVAHV
jgi:hypothetical protein